MAAIEAYPSRAGLYDYYGTGFADIAVVGIDYRTMLLNQFNNLAERLPQIVGFVQNKLLPWLNSVSGDYIQIDQESIIAWLQSHTDELSNTLKEWIPTLMRQSGNVISGVSNLVLLPLLLYYFLLIGNAGLPESANWFHAVLSRPTPGNKEEVWGGSGPPGVGGGAGMGWGGGGGSFRRMGVGFFLGFGGRVSGLFNGVGGLLGFVGVGRSGFWWGLPTPPGSSG